MTRKSLNLLIDEDLVKKARNHGLNLSKFFENQLHGYFNFIEGQHNNYAHCNTKNTDNQGKENKSMDLSGFEPEASSMPRKRSSELIYRPIWSERMIHS